MRTKRGMDLTKVIVGGVEGCAHLPRLSSVWYRIPRKERGDWLKEPGEGSCFYTYENCDRSVDTWSKPCSDVFAGSGERGESILGMSRQASRRRNGSLFELTLRVPACGRRGFHPLLVHTFHPTIAIAIPFTCQHHREPHVLSVW